MAARDFTNETLLPRLELEIADEAKGNRHYFRGSEDAMRGMPTSLNRIAITGKPARVAQSTFADR